MNNETLKRYISEFLDGDLNKSEVEELFGDLNTYDSCKEYLDILRMIKRESLELGTETPENVKEIILKKAIRYKKNHKKANIIKIITLLLGIGTAFVFAYFYYTQYFLVKDINSSVPASSVASDVSSDTSSIASSDIASSEIINSSVDYSTFLPYGDGLLPIDYKNTKFKYVIIVNTGNANAIDSDSRFMEIFDDKYNPIFVSTVSGESAKNALKTMGYENITLIADYNFDGLDETAKNGVIFVASN